ncbi:MAG: gluconate 2-dehydrogenase subunit 3 family protein [Ferruginibacter sp.]|nr:gluconate 2-dehydrogenase subunit 3 family protein [Ferruginibacter sp.]
MNRRNAISNIVLLSMGAMVLPSCGQKDEPLVKLNNFSITKGEEQTLSQLSDTIIPKSNFTGDENVNPREFILVMVDDCYEPERQKRFIAGLKQFDKMSKEKYAGSFTALDAGKKKSLLAGIEKKEDIPEDVLFFYETTKRHTVQALTSSRDYMTKVLKYNMVPGSNFKGCVPTTKV